MFSLIQRSQFNSCPSEHRIRRLYRCDIDHKIWELSSRAKLTGFLEQRQH